MTTDSSILTFPHPDDGRPVFVFPWEGATLLGTTDLDLTNVGLLGDATGLANELGEGRPI